jgi:hypothetical protein
VGFENFQTQIAWVDGYFVRRELRRNLQEYSLLDMLGIVVDIDLVGAGSVARGSQDVHLVIRHGFRGPFWPAGLSGVCF